ncbi:MAG: NAD(P)H-binding protein, partial [Gemmatimonadaceae bacterium]|nr:NAD(P)H-binding protein [Gemmatimonadaceae bacterium]
MPPTKLIVVAGATGRLGQLTITALLAHPDVRIRALVRDPASPSAASLHGRTEVMRFDAESADAAACAAATAGAFAVVSTLQGGPG